MAAAGVSSVKSEKNSRTIIESLSLAFLEWTLIFLLFVNALLSYLTTKFSHYCGLHTPCLLCSRLDHILGKERLNFYWDMICSHHKAEISSLVLCHAHSKLVDVHGICENCLFSFATINKSNAETYRLLVGKLGGDSDSGSSADEDEEFNSPEGHGVGKSTTKLCSCCNKPWISKGPTETLMQTTSIMSQLAELDVPLSGVIGALKNIGDGSSKRIMNRVISDMSHVGYTELKITSDTESEVPFSDDDEINSLALKRVERSKKVDPLINVSSNDEEVEFEEPEVDAIGVQNDDSMVPGVGHGLEEINWQNSEIKDEDSKDSLVETSNIDEEVKNEEQEIEVDAAEVQNDNSVVPSVVGHGLEEINWQDSEIKDEDSKDSLVETSNIDEEVKIEEQEIEVDAAEVQKDEPAGPTGGYSLEEIKAESSEVKDKNALQDINWQHFEIKDKDALACTVEEQVSVEHASASVPEREVNATDDRKMDESVPPTVEHGSSDIEDKDEESEEINSQNSEIKDKDDSASIIELISFDDLPSESKSGATFMELSPDTPVTEANEVPEKDSEESLKVETEPIATEKPVEANHVSTDSSPRLPNLLDLGDAYKLAVGNRGRQISGALTEQWLSKDFSSRVSEDLKNLFSQLSAPRGAEPSATAPDLSPKISLTREDSQKTLDALQKRISLERNESGLSQDGSLVSEIEGESTIDRLKRQVEHDRKALSGLYKELEEERSASAIAANQAMAMITRLQEEKATLQMEALQYLRMMEEQAEYDMEALQKSNDLLAEREKEIQDLEEELEFYRINFGDECEFPENPDTHLKMESMSRLKDSTSGFEDERVHILERLKELEKKLNLSSGNCEEEEEARVRDSTQNDTRPESSADNDTSVDDLASIKNEFSYLQKRLEALEADRNFLERTLRQLRVGEEGLQFVKDIASRLQEIRSSEPKADDPPPSC